MNFFSGSILGVLGVLVSFFLLKSTAFLDKRLYKDSTIDDSSIYQDRYGVIKTVLDKYKRPFTLLDIGSGKWNLSFKIAADYPESTCVIIEGERDELLDLCKENSCLHNIIFLNTFITPEQLQRLGECEHFDVVLVCNVKHYFEDIWKKATEALFNLGDHILIEVSSGQDIGITQEEPYSGSFKNYIQGYLCDKKRTGIAWSFRKSSKIPAIMVHIERHKNRLERTYWDKRKKSNPDEYQINSTYEVKELYKKSEKTTTTWYPGINLVTFLALSGIYPPISTIKQELIKLSKAMIYPDFCFWNIIIQGGRLKVIDLAPRKIKFTNDFDQSYYLACMLTALDSEEV